MNLGRFKDGVLETLTLSEGQAEDFEQVYKPAGWKTFKPLDLEKMQAKDAFHRVTFENVEEADCIGYVLREVFDASLVAEEITHLKRKLSETDYKVIKAMELGESAYSHEDWREERSQWRERINELEKMVSDV